MTEPSDSEQALRERLLLALAANRAARLNFPGMFMRLRGEEAGEGALRVTFDEGDWCRNRAGETHWPALGVLLDVALGGATRPQSGSGFRPATVHLHVEFTGAPAAGSLVAESRFQRYTQRTATTQALCAATLTAAGVPVAHASGAFVMVKLPAGTTQATRPWAPRDLAVAPLHLHALDDRERLVAAHFERACAAADDRHPFIEHFWCGVPARDDAGAKLSVSVTPHLGNRVGQVHGGILWGLAANVACAAAAGMRLSNISTWFIAPGEEPALDVRSTVLQRGRSLAVVHTEITRPDGTRVLEATSQHVRE